MTKRHDEHLKKIKEFAEQGGLNGKYIEMITKEIKKMEKFIGLIKHPLESTNMRGRKNDSYL